MPRILNGIRITDAANRTIAIQTPVKRVVAINTASAIIMRALGVDMDRTVVGVTSYITLNPKFWPVLAGKPAFKFTNLNYERLAELKPQLIILYKNSNRTTDEKKLSALGIQWLYLDCNDPRTMDQDIRTLGLLFGKDKEAEELIAWRGRYTRLIAERVDSISTEKKKRVYFYTFLHTNLNKKIYSTKNEKSCSHPLVEDAGGINIAADLPQEYLQVSGEWLMEQNPDAIVGGVIAKTVCGYNADADAARFNLKAMHGQLIKDPVLKETAAVKDGRVLLIAQDLKEGPATVVGTLYIAKFLYPECFADIDPDAILREYHEKWCGLAHRGVYVYPPPSPYTGKAIKPEENKTTLTITDGVGRRVTVPYPLTRVAAASGSYGPEALLALGAGKALVGVGDYAKRHARHISPLLRNTPGIGLKEPSAEKILEIAPQAVIFYECYYPYPKALMNSLKGAGISAIMMDFHRPEVFEQNIRIMGKLIGKADRAEQLITFESQILDRIKQRVGRIPPDQRRRVFFEQYHDLQTVTADNPDHLLLTVCGGIDIFSDRGPSPSLTATVSPEAVIERNPQVIIKHIGSSRITNSGYGATNADALKAVRNRILNRPGWENIDAVKHGRVYVLNTETKATHPSVYCAYIAKWLYPDLFDDFDPVAIYRQWMETFLEVRYKGIYAYPETPVEEKAKTPVPSVSIVDSAGRRVTIPQPLKRIAGLQSSGCREFSLLQVEDRVVGVTEYLQGDPGMLPRLVGKPNIGSVYTPNYEIIAQVEPQVVFMGTAAVNLQPAIDKLTPMGIQVVAMDFQPIRGNDAYAREAHYDEELLLLGRITGKEARARAFVKWKNDLLEMIRSRTASIEKKQVLGLNSVSKLLGGNTFTIWAGKRIIELAGGIDPSAGLSAQEVSGEWVLQQNPEVIIISSYWLAEGLGYGAVDAGRAAEVHKKVRRHPVIGRTRAGQSGNVFLFSYYGVASGGQTALGALYLAKRLYPGRFSDVQPETFHKDYFEKWFDVEYRGVWFYP